MERRDENKLSFARHFISLKPKRDFRNSAEEFASNAYQKGSHEFLKSMAIQISVMSIDPDALGSPPETHTFGKHELTIGRAPSNDLVLDHPGVSGAHARIRVYANSGEPVVYVTDLESTNGTIVGSKRLPPRIEIPVPLRDRIMVGSFIVKIAVVEPEQADLFDQITVEKLAPSDSLVESSAAQQLVPESEVVEGESVSSNLEDVEVVLSEFTRPVPTLESPKSEAKRVVEEVWSVTPEEHPAQEIKSVSIEEPVFEVQSVNESSEFVIDGDVELNFEAVQLLKIQGRITRKGSPVEGVRVSGGELGEVVTSSDGAFLFSDVLEGTRYTIKFSRHGYIFDASEVSGQLDASSPALLVSARKLCTIKGRISHKGVPMSGVTVDGGPLGTTLTDADGHYVFQNVPEGTPYSLRASKDGFVFGMKG